MAGNGKARTRKLKLDKEFRPLPVDEGDEYFANGVFEFNVTKMLAFIESNAEKFPVEHTRVEALGRYSPEGLNEAAIRSANLAVPVILAEISPGRFNVIDGNHRVERARREGRATIATRRVSAEQHLVFLTSAKAYAAYVKYWNEKIRGLEGDRDAERERFEP